jgi:predicted metal-dependent hydrolase
MRLKKTYTEYFLYNDVQVPIEIKLEARNNVRISIAREKVYLRLPGLSSKGFLNKNLKWARKWLAERFDDKPDLLERFRIKRMDQLEEKEINSVLFKFHYKEMNRQGISINVDEEDFFIFYSKNIDLQDHHEWIKKALHKLIGRRFRSEIANRIMEMNQKYFKEDINDVKIKYNKSNWGSCSAKRNINISSRLLFAPKEIQDYVLVHELTHLKELNHSTRFWAIVAKIVPDYKDKERWLKENSHLCDF